MVAWRAVAQQAGRLDILGYTVVFLQELARLQAG
jgi:hypothetical protein